MSKFTIYSPDGTALYTGTPTFTGQYMKPGMVEFREVASPSVLDFRTGCYLGYEDNGTIVPIYSRTGFVYKMYSVPQVKKQARPYSHGAAFVYQSVQLYDASKMLEFCPFRDLVAGDNRIHFSTQPSISTFEGVDGLARRFQACLEDMYGAGTWQVRVATTEEGLSPEMATLMAEARDFTVSGVNILECLDKVYEIWPEVGWIYKVESVNGSPTDTIVIGGGGLNANYGTYAYGKGKGLKSITRTVANADELANRIFAYGSSRNMLPGWYNNQNIKDAQSVDIQNLMIPVANWGTTEVDGVDLPDASKAYVQDGASIQRLGLRPTTVYFDGSGEYPEIYPSIRNKTIGQLRNAIGSQYADYYPNPSIYTNPYERIDRVLSVDGTFDSGLVGMAGKSASVQSSEVLGDMTDSDTLEGGSNTSVVLAMRTFEMTKTCATDLYVSMTGDGTITTTGDNVSVYIALSIQKGDGTDFTEVKRQLFELAPDDNGVFHTRTVSTKAKDTEVAVNDIVRVFLSLFIMNNSATDISYTYSVSPRFNFSAAWSRKKTFTITLRQLGFDIGEQAALGEGKTIAMRSGKCTGRSFTIKDVQYDAENDAWVLECFRSEDESLSQWFPNTQYPIRGLENAGQSNEYPGDEFVLLDIAMPELYISMAEGELLQAAQDLLLDTATERWQYVPDIDAKFMVENNRTIRSGEYMTLLDMDFIEAEEGTTSYFKTSNDVYLLTSHGEKIRLDDGSGSVVAALVDTIVINEGEAAIPTYKVTLRDRKRKTWTDSQGAEAPVSKSVGSITEAQAEESYSSGGDSFFMLDEDGNITLKSQYQNLWVPGWLAAGGVGDEGGGGGGVSYLRELTDVYHNSSSVLRADGTGAVVGDALVYTTAHGWVAAAQTGGISSVVLSAGSANGTLKLTVNGVAGSDVAVPGLGSLAFKSSLDASDIPPLSGLYLPLTGGELSGDLRLKGAANYGRKLLLGDGNYAYLHEDTDDHLKIYGDKGIELSTGSGYGVTINGQPLDWFVVETIDNNPTLKLNPRYAGLWAEGWVAAGGAGSGSGGGGSNVSVESLADTTAQVSRIAKITIDGTDTYLYNDVAWGTATYTNNTVDVKINGTTKRLCLDGYSSGGGGGVSSVTLAEGTANGTLRLYVNGTAGSNVSVPGLGDLAFLDSLSASDISGLSDAYVTLSGSSQIITSAKTFQSANITLRTAYLYPYSDGTCGIGAANKRFANIYGTYGDFSRNLTLSNNSTLYIGTAELSYDANTIALHLSGTDDESGRSVGLEVNDDAYIDIGKARLAYDDGAKALHITYKQGTGQTIGLYADGFVAAGGVAGQSNINFVTTDSSEQAISGIKKFTNLKVTNLSAISSDIALTGTINGLTIVKEQGYISIRDASNRLYIQDNTRHLVLGGNSSSGCIYVGGYSGASGYKMYVQNGDVYFSDNAYASSWNTSSDRRLKENITTLSKADAIEKIMALNPSVWQWNSGANKGMTATGFVAQEVESVIPFMVGGKEYKSLAYQMLHAYEISAIQSHEERIIALEKRLTD